MGRAMPVECIHGKILDWGDFGGDDAQPQPCDACEARQKIKHRILWNVRDQGIDEIVIDHPELVHIEQMNPRCWWIGIYIDGLNRWSGNFSCDSRGRMQFTQQDCDIEWDDDDSHDEKKPLANAEGES